MTRKVVVSAAAGVLVIAVLVARLSVRAGAATHGAGDTTGVAVLGPSDVARAARADLIAGLPVSGTLEPARQVRIAAPIAEVVDAVLVKEGTAVRAGQVLARFRITAIEPAAAAAEAQRRKAAVDYGRMQNLLNEGAVSEQDVEAAEVSLRAAEGSAARAQKNLDDAVVRAPMSGVISRRAVESGDRVKDGDMLFELVNTRELEFQASVPSEYVAQVRRGAPVVLAVTGAPAVGLAGRVARVNATADPATRQVQVYVTVANRSGTLVGGLFAAGRIVLHQVKGAVAVPPTAVRGDDAAAGSYVLIVEHGRIARRDVSTGARDEAAALVEITRGLQGGETVIVGPASGLRPGDAVSVAGEGR